MKRNLQIILLIALMGCAPIPPATGKPTEIQLPSPIATLTLESTPTDTPTPVFTMTNTALPLWTAIPTISTDTGLQLLYKRLEGTEDCRLPCWANITPGQTTWDEARHWIEPMSGFAKLTIFLNESCVFGECNEIRWSLSSPGDGHGYIYSQLPENVIHANILELTDPFLMQALSLQRILTKHGEPEILLFSTEPDQPGQKFLELILVYPEKQFLIKYSKYAELHDDNVESCRGDSYIKLVVLDNSEQLISLDAIANAVETRDFHVDVWHKPAEESIGMTIDEFYTMYKESDAPCIATPTRVWQP